MTAENIATSTPGIYTGHMSVFEMLLSDPDDMALTWFLSFQFSPSSAHSPAPPAT